MPSFTVDELITKYTLHDHYSAPAARVVTSTNAVAAAQTRAGTAMAGATAASSVLSVAMMGIAASALIAATAFLKVNEAFVSNAIPLMQVAAEWEALGAALKAVEGSAAAAGREMRVLREIAKGPGLGFREAIQGYVQLRAGGIGSQLSESLLREFGNQIALRGGGKAELDRVMRAAMQMAVKPFLQGEELLQLTEAGIPGHRLVQKAFGTSDTEELKRRGISSTQVLEALVAEMAKSERVAGSAKNTFENLSDALDYAKASAGAALNQAFMPTIAAFGEMIDLANDAGIITTVFQSLANSFDYFNLAGTHAEEIMLALGAALMTVGDVVSVAAAAFGALIDALLPIARSGIEGNVQNWIEGRFETNRDILAQQLALFRKRGPQSMEAAPPPTPAEERQIEALQKIVYNTEPLRLNMDKNVFGGGDIGRLGVTPVELGMIRSGRTPREVRVRIDGDKTVGAAVLDVLAQLRSQGVVLSGA